MDLDMDSFAVDEQVIPTTEVEETPEISPAQYFLLQTSISRDVSEIPNSPRTLADFSIPISSVQQRKSNHESQASDSSGERTELQPVLEPVIVKVPRPRFPPLPRSTLRSGIVYDVRMRFHQDPLPVEDEGPHPEDPRRIIEIFRELVEAGLAADPESTEIMSDDLLLRLTPREATLEEIQLVHSPEHIKFIKELGGNPNGELKRLELETSNSVYFHNLTWLCASLAAGCATVAAEAVVNGFVKNAVAVIRPPGHHAEPPEPETAGHHEPGGFCIFNNVSVATKVMQDKYAHLCRKVLILDWDVHHGNGVQKAFYDDPNVLYISLHRYENTKFYPYSKIGDLDACGDGLGLGRNVNIPWSCAHMGDADYIYAFQQVVMPISVEFDPDLVVIAAGFDAADGDYLGQCHVTPAGFAHMTHMLMQLAEGKVVACLEGGYNHRAIAKSFLAMTRTLMGEPPDRMTDLEPRPETVRTIRDVIRMQSKFWKCLYPKDVQLRRLNTLGSERLHDVIREWSAQKFFEEFGMTNLAILRQSISKSLENQVLASPNFDQERPLLVIFHDPPEALGFPHPITNELELHNTWLTDISKTYVAWALENDFAVIDVNIPKYLTDERTVKGYSDADPHQSRREATKEVARYLWTNYLEIGDSTHLFMMGVGDAHAGILELYADDGSALAKTDLTIGFIASNALPRLSSMAYEGSSRQYYENSMVFVSEDHNAWESQKIRRRHGNLIKSPCTSLQDMLALHKEQITNELLRRSEDWRARDKEDVISIGEMNEDAATEDEVDELSRDDIAMYQEEVGATANHENAKMNEAQTFQTKVSFESENVNSLPESLSESMALHPTPSSLPNLLHPTALARSSQYQPPEL